MATPSPAMHWNPELMKGLFARGLGELLILHVQGSDVVLGHLGLKKNRLMLSDTKFLTGVRPGDVVPCWELGLLGMITASEHYEWQSLTFHGLNQCQVKVDLSQTRGGRLMSTRDLEGEDLMDFFGSVYRGFRWLLDRHFLPVVTLQPLQTKHGEWGLAVVDLRMGTIELSATRTINDAVRRSIERHMEVDMVEEIVQSDKFDELFSGFLPQPRQAAPQKAAPPAPAQRAPVAKVFPAAAPESVVAEPAMVAQNPLVQILVPGETVEHHHFKPADVLEHALDMLKVVVDDVGAPRAFALFERWVTRVAVAKAYSMQQPQKVACRTVHDYFVAIAAQMRLAGETHVILEEGSDTILHEIRDCIYREACRSSGVDPEGRWSTCAQTIPGVRGKVAAALDPRLAWSWTSCDRRAGHACVFELSFKDKTEAGPE